MGALISQICNFFNFYFFKMYMYIFFRDKKPKIEKTQLSIEDEVQSVNVIFSG